MMIVAELIAMLQQFPEQTRVVVDGYEGDADDIAHMAMKFVEIDGNMKPQDASGLPDSIPHHIGAGRHKFVDEGDENATPVLWIKREDWGRNG
jgi:hypothetical protein